jgi:Mrp family chromosome partitioning ATPase
MSACEENYNSGNGECSGCESGECGGCGSNGGCSGCCGAKTDFREPANKWSNIKKVIGIVSGKGGVGKSSVTSLMACAMRNAGKNVGILDADITGPSIPKAFGISEKALGNQDGIFPVQSATGIDVMSVNLLLENDTDPVVWRGSMIANAVKQFWGDVIWGDQDYLFVDMPPGTGDVPLTVFQSLPVDGIIIVTSPQELVSMIVGKAVKMAQMMNVPILGIVENMSYFHCPDNGKDYQIFGESHIEEVAEEYGVQVLGRMPIDPMIAQACDGGRIEFLEKNPMEMVAAAVDRQFA